MPAPVPEIVSETFVATGSWLVGAVTFMIISDVLLCPPFGSDTNHPVTVSVPWNIVPG